jgi:polyisoprenoid-binding protein YceI
MSIYQIDPAHSNIGFNIKHMVVTKVHGAFEKLQGSFSYDAANPANSKVEATIDATSLTTRDAARDTHLKSADFFDVEKFPTIHFVSTSFSGNAGDLKILGNLTIHGVTKAVTLDLEGPSEEIKDPWGNLKIGVSATTKIKRKDFGLTWNAALEAGGVLVGEDVNIILDVQLLKQV